MAALKPRTSVGPLDAQRDRGDIVVFMPVDHAGERLVFTLSEGEALVLARILTDLDGSDAGT